MNSEWGRFGRFLPETLWLNSNQVIAGQAFVAIE
jgi:hypothetical protein